MAQPFSLRVGLCNIVEGLHELGLEGLFHDRKRDIISTVLVVLVVLVLVFAIFGFCLVIKVIIIFFDISWLIEFVKIALVGTAIGSIEVNDVT